MLVYILYYRITFDVFIPNFMQNNMLSNKFIMTFSLDCSMFGKNKLVLMIVTYDQKIYHK